MNQTTTFINVTGLKIYGVGEHVKLEALEGIDELNGNLNSREFSLIKQDDNTYTLSFLWGSSGGFFDDGYKSVREALDYLLESDTLMTITRDVPENNSTEYEMEGN